MGRRPPRRVEALKTTSSEPASIIFLHGYDDDCDSWTDVAHQFQSANKLPHLSWIFPNAPFNNEARATAWYTPVAFSPIPMPSSSSYPTTSSTDPVRPPSPTPEEQQEEREMMESVNYVDGLIEEELKRGAKKERIVVGGFSQGCAVTLLVGLLGKWRGKLGGVVGLSGYLPDGEWVRRRMIMKKLSVDDGDVSGSANTDGGDEPSDTLDNNTMRIFLAHGTRDMLVPMWIFRDAKKRIVDLLGEDDLEVHQYEGMGHNTSGSEFRDMCLFLERILS